MCYSTLYLNKVFFLDHTNLYIPGTEDILYMSVHAVPIHCMHVLHQALMFVSWLLSIVQRPNRPDVSVYLQPAENNNSVKMCDEFLHGLVAAGWLYTVTFWPFCLPNLSVTHLCPEAACCLAPIIYSLTSCNLSIHYLYGHFWGFVEHTHYMEPGQNQTFKYCLWI